MRILKYLLKGIERLWSSLLGVAEEGVGVGVVIKRKKKRGAGREVEGFRLGRVGCTFYDIFCIAI
jgi:hypothetical protein